MKIVRRGVGEGVLSSVDMCGEFLDGLFCRGKLCYMISNATL